MIANDFGGKAYSWLIHLFTASGVLFGLFALNQVFNGNLLYAMWLMAAAVFVDAVDGTLARYIDVKYYTPTFDGALLDNIIDFLNYSVVPACFLLEGYFVPNGWHITSATAILLASCYQFCQSDAKTNDHFFKGFPSFWNITIFYLFFWQTNEWTNLFILAILFALSFIPIKYVYPSQLDNLTRVYWLKKGMGVATVTWGASAIGLLWLYPQTSVILLTITLLYVFLYFGVSIYRTFVPMQ